MGGLGDDGSTGVWRGGRSGVIASLPLHGGHGAFSKVGKRWLNRKSVPDCCSGNAGLVVPMGEARGKDLG